MKFIIHDGGLCLLAPFLNNFFENLFLVTKNNLAGEDKKAKAYFILQYIVNGTIDYKIINHSLAYYFAAKPNMAIYDDIQLTEKEILECNILLQTIISYIPNLKKISIETFQKEFLQREGVLGINTNELRIERKSIDVILETVPWNFHIIKLPWLQNIFTVEW